MKGLDDAQISAVQSARKSGIIHLPASMLEKDLLVRDAVAIVCGAGCASGAEIIFCGGTALSQAHEVIERMSEDADFRIVVPASVVSHSAQRRFLSSVKSAIQKSWLLSKIHG